MSVFSPHPQAASASPLSAPSCLGMLLSLAGCWRFWARACRRPVSCYYYWELFCQMNVLTCHESEDGVFASFCLISTNSAYSTRIAPPTPKCKEQGRRHSEIHPRTPRGPSWGVTSAFWWVERSALSILQEQQALVWRLRHSLSTPQKTWCWEESCGGIGAVGLGG